jgi:hypothetical protein
MLKGGLANGEMRLVILARTCCFCSCLDGTAAADEEWMSWARARHFALGRRESVGELDVDPVSHISTGNVLEALPGQRSMIRSPTLDIVR